MKSGAEIGDRRGRSCTTKVSVRDAGGKITGLVGITLDITEREPAREALDRERALLRTLIDLLPDHVLREGRPRQFILANRAVAQGSWARPGLVPDREIRQGFLSTRRRCPIRSAEEDVLAGRSMFNKEESVTHPDGVRRFVLPTRCRSRTPPGTSPGWWASVVTSPNGNGGGAIAAERGETRERATHGQTGELGVRPRQPHDLSLRPAAWVG